MPDTYWKEHRDHKFDRKLMRQCVGYENAAEIAQEFNALLYQGNTNFYTLGYRNRTLRIWVESGIASWEDQGYQPIKYDGEWSLDKIVRSALAMEAPQ
jgi:hypothetical protein